MKALEGLRVIDMSTVIAGPFAGNIFSDFGAEVIKLEMPKKGDAFRTSGPFKDRISIRWDSMARNKKSITLDLHDEKAKEIFLKLVSISDAIIENFRVGTLDKWGLDIETLRKANPKIIVTRITGYGQTGPYKDKSGFGTPCTAFAGVTHPMGYPDRAPVSPFFSLADYVSGMNAVIGTMIALYNRDVLNGAQSQEIDVSLYESMFRMQESLVADYYQNGVIKERKPKMSGSASPSGTFKTKDNKWVVIVCSTDKTFAYIADAWGRPDLKEKYAKTPDRLKDDDLILKYTQEWVEKFDYVDLRDECLKYQVPMDLVYDIEDIFNDPHYEARNNIVEMPSQYHGTAKMPSVTPILSETPGKIEWAGPTLGQHNDEIYKELLNIEDEVLEELKENGFI